MIRERAIEILAEDNIRRVGAVVAHPRTGAPLELPGLKGLAELWEEGTRDLGVEPE